MPSPFGSWAKAHPIRCQPGKPEHQCLEVFNEPRNLKQSIEQGTGRIGGRQPQLSSFSESRNDVAHVHRNVEPMQSIL